MNEREMLEYAARACGLKGFIHEWINGPDWVIPGENPKTFNPLKDDGDGARMEAMLGIELRWDAGCVRCSWHGAYFAENLADHDDDKQAARRLASLRVAAEIGRAM